MRPTISTVAREAGVAVSTVSRYLNGQYVSRPVKSRLGKIIARLGYSRSWTARNLSLGRRGSVGLLVDSSHSPWFSQLLIGIEKELAARELSLMLCTISADPRPDLGVGLGWIREHRVDGLLVVKFGRRERPLLQEALRSKIPTVLLSPREAVNGPPVVRCDNIGAGRAIAHHLAGLGHERIAFEGGIAHLDVRDRLRGLRAGLAERGISQGVRRASFCGSLEAQAGADFADRFFAKNSNVTAVVFGNDLLALGFMRAALQRGVRIPQEICVSGFDDIPESALAWPGLTTVAQPMQEMGQLACRKLFGSPHEKMHSFEYPMQLVVRESTGAPV